MHKVKKAIIPAAGLGTRFLPATKSVPKEMLTIVDAPIIFYVVEEAISAGIEDIILIQGRGKSSIEDFFDTSYELEDRLLKSGQIELLSRIVRIREMANIISVRQKQALGLGHAVLCGQRVIGSEPFAVLLGDEIMISQPNQKSAIGELIQHYENLNGSIVGMMQVSQADISKYGCIDFEKNSAGPYRIRGLVEKPKPEEAPSNWAILGRYVFSNGIFDELSNQTPGINGEIQLTDAMNRHSRKSPYYASALSAKRFDAGDKLGYIKANIEVGLMHPELRSGLLQYIRETANSLGAK
ncbi:MAG: putative UTP--glucose-1-phosphate uridylyltransferase YngB [Oligoflexia bacterium]|nr:MAG: putative UTP--glucose-1-phosphate uridylyltransferase YngB [Oligoflexia bacterium]